MFPNRNVLHADILATLRADHPDVPERVLVREARWHLCRWIDERYRRGESPSAIARERDCTPAAISQARAEAKAMGDTSPMAEWLQTYSGKRRAA